MSVPLVDRHRHLAGLESSVGQRRTPGGLAALPKQLLPATPGSMKGTLATWSLLRLRQCWLRGTLAELENYQRANLSSRAWQVQRWFRLLLLTEDLRQVLLLHLLNPDVLQELGPSNPPSESQN